MFETAGVARTERSIVSWCQPNRTGIARLDAYFDPNDRRYYITPQSVELAIKEEQAKAARRNDTPEDPGAVPKTSAGQNRQSAPDSDLNPASSKRLDQEILDLKITNRGKDYFIEELKSEREAFVQERQGYVEKLMSFNRQVGELQTKLLQLEGPEMREERENPFP